MAKMRFAEPLFRGVALFLGLFILLGLLWFLAFDIQGLNLLWIDLRFLPEWLQVFFLAIVAVSFLIYASKGKRDGSFKPIFMIILASLVLVTGYNSIVFYRLLSSGLIKTRLPLPFSFSLFSLFLSWIFWLHSRPGNLSSAGDRFLTFGFALGMVIVAPLSQMLFFGETNYARRADAILVFGARALSNGNPSDALSDRIETAIRLYKSGYADKLILSGGAGDGEMDEPEVMREIALRKGVPYNALLLDRRGLNTLASVENILRLPKGGGRLLVVSHFYHLPRIKTLFQSRHKEVFTVPAESPRILAKLPLFLFREVVAWWVYLLREPGWRKSDHEV